MAEYYACNLMEEWKKRVEELEDQTSPPSDQNFGRRTRRIKRQLRHHRRLTRASRLFAGPVVVISYAIAGFSYIRVTFGEFTAFITGANLVIDYVLSNATVARSLTAYLGTAIVIGFWRGEWKNFTEPSDPIHHESGF